MYKVRYISGAAGGNGSPCYVTTTVLDAEYPTIERAAKVRKWYSNRGYTAWVQTDRGVFVPVKGAMKAPRAASGSA